MAISTLALRQDADNPTKKWLHVMGAEGVSQLGQFTLTDQEFQALQNAGLTPQREWNNPLYQNQGAFSDPKNRQLLTSWMAPLPAGIGIPVGTKSGYDPITNRIGWITNGVWSQQSPGGYGEGQEANNTILNKVFSTDVTKLAGASLADPYADTTLWQKTPYMGGHQVTYIGPKGGPQDPEKGFNAGLSNVQAPANIQQAGSNVIDPALAAFNQSMVNAPKPNVPTADSIQQGIDDLLKRIQTEGITGAKGEVLLAPGSLATSGGKITPSIVADKLGGDTTKAIDVTGTTPTGTTANDNAAGAVASATSSKDFIDEYLKNISVEKDDEYKTTLNALKSEISGQKSKETLQAEEEQAQGLQAKKEALTLAKGKLAALEAEFNKYSLDEQGKPITLASIQGAVQAKRNAIAGDMLLLQADVALNTDQYNDAVTAVNNAVNLKYSSAQDSINNRLKLLELIGGELDKTETAKKDAMTAWLNQQNTILSTQKSYDLALYNQKLDLISKYGVGSTTDSLETLNQKKLNSAIYKKEIQASGGTQSEIKQTMMSNASQAFESVKGRDGYISPQDWYKLRAAWLQQGGLLKDFLDNFSIYANPADPQDYGLTS